MKIQLLYYFSKLFKVKIKFKKKPGIGTWPLGILRAQNGLLMVDVLYLNVHLIKPKKGFQYSVRVFLLRISVDKKKTNKKVCLVKKNVFQKVNRIVLYPCSMFHEDWLNQSLLYTLSCIWKQDSLARKKILPSW